MSRACAALLLVVFGIATPLAQDTGPAPVEKGKAAAGSGTQEAALGQPVNVKLDLTITDQTGTNEPSKKTVTLVIADRATGSIRSAGSVRAVGQVQLNVDARPQILQSGSIRVFLGLEYSPRISGGENSSGWTSLNEQLGVVLQPGRALVVSQATDPASDRKITVELTATLLKP